MTCFYSQPTCTSKITKEHVISNSVLKAVFGNPIRNKISADHLGTKVLIDAEPVVKDVCSYCNNFSLSPYDIAGVSLINQLHSHDATGLRLQITNETFGWILKTHLNYFRIIKDAEAEKAYPVSQRIKDGLIQKQFVPHDQFRLYVEGWEGEPFFWDAEDDRRIHWFQYRSIRFRAQKIVLSELRIKTLTTWILIPSNNDYDSFDERVDSVMREIKKDFGFSLQHVDVGQTIYDGFLDVFRILSINEIRKFIIRK